MTDVVPTPYSPSEVSPPGETLRELLRERGIPEAELALRMGRPQNAINEIINGKAALTHEAALGLEHALGAPASFWNSREGTYRAYLASREAEQQHEED